MKMIRPFASVKEDGLKVFLAGAIDMGKAVDWQTEIANRFLDEKDIVFINPRSIEYAAGLDETPEKFRERILWELNGLEKSNLIVLFLPKNSIAPISLLELGLFSRSNKLAVAVEPGYHRYINVVVTCEHYKIPVFDSLEGLDKIIRNALELYRFNSYIDSL